MNYREGGRAYSLREVEKVGYWLRGVTEQQVCIDFSTPLSETFRRVRKISRRDYYVCPSECPHGTGFPLDRFNEIWYIFRKFVDKIQVSLNSDNNNGHFTWRPIYIFYHISLNSS